MFGTGLLGLLGQPKMRARGRTRGPRSRAEGILMWVTLEDVRGHNVSDSEEMSGARVNSRDLVDSP